MTPVILGFWLFAASWPLSALPPPDLHVVVESEFHYLASIRTTTIDAWMSEGKQASKTGDILTIRREDLGVRWRVNLKAGSYTEEKIGPPAPPPPPPNEDIHTVGQTYYEPEFEWAVKETSQATSLAGRPCRQVVATGDADFAEATVKFWVCQPIAQIGHPLNSVVTALLRSRSVRTMVEAAAAKRGKAWILGVEETQEPSIATTMTTTVTVKTLEATAAPAGTFELPANLKKAGR